MRITRFSAVAAVATAGALALAGCGSDNTTTNAASGGSATGGGTAGSIAGVGCATGSLTLAGSTAQSNAMSTWIKAYQQACPGSSINYGGGGSGAGVTQFSNGTIDFAGSDFPLGSSNQDAADQRCSSGPAINLPMVPGPIAVGYNVPGVTSLNLSATTLAKIFSGKVMKWNDPAIAADNKGATLPDLAIQTFHRSDGSGTSFNFTNYLASEASADWSYGANKDWKAPGGQGDKGSATLAADVKKTSGGIGYMEQSFATANSIPFAKVSNAKGDFVELTSQNVSTFLSKAKIEGTSPDVKLAFDYTNGDTDAYPNLLVTYEIVCSKGNKSDKLPLMKSFLSYIVSNDAQQSIASQGYVPLPSNIQDKVKSSIASLG